MPNEEEHLARVQELCAAEVALFRELVAESGCAQDMGVWCVQRIWAGAKAGL